MATRATLGILMVPLGVAVAVCYALPDLSVFFQISFLVLGCWMMAVGGLYLLAAWSANKPHPVCQKYISLVEWFERAWGGWFILLTFINWVPLVIFGLAYWVVTTGSIQFTAHYPTRADSVKGEVTLGLDIVNDTGQTVYFDDFRIIELSTDTRIYTPYEGINRCHNSSVMQYKYLSDDVDPTDAGHTPGGYDLTTNGQAYFAEVVKQNSLMENGVANTAGIVEIPAHQPTSLFLKFPTMHQDFTKWNSSVLCPTFRVFGSHIHNREIVCRGSSMTLFPITEFDDRRKELDWQNYANVPYNSGASWGTISSWPNKSYFVTNDDSQGDCS
jgi:hypothetical protein